MTATLSLTQSQVFTALRSFLLTLLPSGVEVLQGQANRVAQPAAPNFAVIWPLRFDRLGTGTETVYDNSLVGSIADATLTVTAVVQATLTVTAVVQATPLGPNAPIYGTGVAEGTAIVTQLSGSVGGTGVYRVAPGGQMVSGTLYSGMAYRLTAIQSTIQCDVHGPNSFANVEILQSLFKSEQAVENFQAFGYDITPLYCDTARQLPYLNDQDQVEDRWVLEMVIQLSPVVGVGQRFADQLVPTTIEVDATYPP